MRYNISRLREKIANSIKKRRASLKMRHLQDLVAQQKRLPFIKKIAIDDDIACIQLKGAVDSSTIPLIKQKGRRELTGQRHIILDFADVKHIDSSTLSELTMLFLELKAHNKKLAIINATRELLDYIDILKLNSIVNIYNSRRAAMEALKR